MFFAHVIQSVIGCIISENLFYSFSITILRIQISRFCETKTRTAHLKPNENHFMYN